MYGEFSELVIKNLGLSNIADDLYRAYCTEMVKYFTEDCEMLPEI